MNSKKDLISILDIDSTGIKEIINLARQIKKKPTTYSKKLQGKTLGIILQKPSTRTAISFAVGMYELGGLPLILNAQDLQLKRGETPGDTARVLSRYIAGIVIRANSHNDVVELARESSIPVINGLTDQEHPCQILSDILTIMEKKKIRDIKDLAGLSITYIGDGNNVANTWLLAAGILGLKLTVSCPKNYEPQDNYVLKAFELEKRSGSKIIIEANPKRAATGADVIYSDVWTSMGMDDEREKRKRDFAPYQINSGLLAVSKKDAVVMHCLPAHRGEEITSDVLDGPHSIVFDQVENRLHVQKAILVKYLQKIT